MSLIVVKSILSSHTCQLLRHAHRTQDIRKVIPTLMAYYSSEQRGRACTPLARRLLSGTHRRPCRKRVEVDWQKTTFLLRRVQRNAEAYVFRYVTWSESFVSTEVSAPIHLSIVRVSERVVRAIAMKRQQAQETMNMWLRTRGTLDDSARGNTGPRGSGRVRPQSSESKLMMYCYHLVLDSTIISLARYESLCILFLGIKDKTGLQIRIKLHSILGHGYS